MALWNRMKKRKKLKSEEVCTCCDIFRIFISFVVSYLWQRLYANVIYSFTIFMCHVLQTSSQANIQFQSSSFECMLNIGVYLLLLLLFLLLNFFSFFFFFFNSLWDTLLFNSLAHFTSLNLFSRYLSSSVCKHFSKSF